MFDSILASSPYDLTARYLIGRTGALSGQRLERAQLELTAFLAAPRRENAPRPASAHWRLGMVYEKQGRSRDPEERKRQGTATHGAER